MELGTFWHRLPWQQHGTAPSTTDRADPGAPPPSEDRDHPEETALVAEQPPVKPPARMPVPPLLADLAGWGWRVLVLGGLAVLLLWIAQRLFLVSLPVAASLLLTALLSPVVSALRR